jgi:hypothetical protein
MSTLSEILCERINREVWPQHVVKIVDAALACGAPTR